MSEVNKNTVLFSKTAKEIPPQPVLPAEVKRNCCEGYQSTLASTLNISTKENLITPTLASTVEEKNNTIAQVTRWSEIHWGFISQEKGKPKVITKPVLVFLCTNTYYQQLMRGGKKWKSGQIIKQE